MKKETQKEEVKKDINLVSPKIEKELAYYLTMFKIEGHGTWRASLSGHKEGFNNEVIAVAKKMVVTTRQDFRIDRITGAITKIKESVSTKS